MRDRTNYALSNHLRKKCRYKWIKDKRKIPFEAKKNMSGNLILGGLIIMLVPHLEKLDKNKRVVLKYRAIF